VAGKMSGIGRDHLAGMGATTSPRDYYRQKKQLKETYGAKLDSKLEAILTPHFEKEILESTDAPAAARDFALLVWLDDFTRFGRKQSGDMLQLRSRIYWTTVVRQPNTLFGDDVLKFYSNLKQQQYHEINHF
jgi:hypothetical protein